MKYETKKTELVSILQGLGYEVVSRKSVIPETLPAAIIGLSGELGVQKTSGGYAKYRHKADIYLVIEDAEDADIEILQRAHTLELRYNEIFHGYFSEIEIYDSTINSVEPVLIALIKVEI